MLTICVGPNGSGKSLWALHQVIRFLYEDSRLIVTSLAIDFGRLNEYLQRGRKPAPDLLKRLFKIDGEEMRTFWRYRGIQEMWTDGSDDTCAGWGIRPIVFGPFGGEDWRQVNSGVVYVLDEVQTVFGAREWQKTGPEFVAYQSQHRKFGDDVIAISPASALVDKQFRILAGECVALRNLYKLRVGPVKAPRKICYSVFQNCPPVPAETALASGSFQIDGEGLASCYNTSAGLGIAGVDADKGKEAKGLPFYTMFIGLAVLCLLAWFVFSRGFRWAVNRGIEKTRISSTATPTPAPTNAPQLPQHFQFLEQRPQTPSGVKVTGYFSGVGLALSDGRVLKDGWRIIGSKVWVPGEGLLEMAVVH